MNKYISKTVKTTGDLEKLEKENPGVVILGVTNSKLIYTINDGEIVSITADKAAELLDVEIEIVQNIINDPNGYVYEELEKEPIETQNETVEETVFNEQNIEEYKPDLDERLEVLEKEVNVLRQTIETLEAEIEAVKKTILL